MSLADNLKNVTSNMQQSATSVTITFFQRALRLVSGFFVGIVLSLIIQEFAQSGTLMLLFFTTLFMLIVYKLLRPLSVFQIFIFDVICILIAISLRMYVMIAP